MQTVGQSPTAYCRPWLRRLAALALVGVALLIAMRCGARLPLLQQAAITSEKLQRAIEAAGRSAAREMQVADALRYLSDTVAAAWRNPNQLIEANSRVFAILSSLPNEGIPRYAAATLAMISMERDGTPPTEWWKRVKAWLDAKGTLSFSHHLRALHERDAGIYRSIGLSPGLAARDADRGFVGGHGIFLQLVAPRLDMLRNQLRADGQDDVADRLTADWRRWLALWVREPGPTELRMLAADLLARELSPRETENGPRGDSELAAKLIEWRNAWRTAQTGRPAGLTPLDPVSQRPEIAPAEHDRAARWLFICLVALLAMLTAALVALLTLAAREPVTARQSKALRVALFIAIPALAAVAGFVPAFADPEFVAANLRAWGSRFTVTLLWPALLTAAALLMTLFPFRGAALPGRLARAATTALPGLSLLLIIASLQLSATLNAYDRRVATVIEERFENPFAGTDAPALPPPTLP
jgi:hypothetical protein